MSATNQTVGGWLFAGFIRELSIFGGMLMRNLKRSRLDVDDNKYCSDSHQYWCDNLQYLFDTEKITSKKTADKSFGELRSLLIVV